MEKCALDHLKQKQNKKKGGEFDNSADTSRRMHYAISSKAVLSAAVDYRTIVVRMRGDSDLF